MGPPPGQVQRFGDLHAAGDDVTALHRALDHLAHEAAVTGTPPTIRNAILQRLLGVLLLRLTHQAAPVGTLPGEHAETFQRFRRAVESDFARARDVGHYAKALGDAPRTLTRASLAAVGVGAKDYIDRRVILEAKRLLAHDDAPVVSIAARRSCGVGGRRGSHGGASTLWQLELVRFR